MSQRLYEVEDSIASVGVAAILLALTVPADSCVRMMEAAVTVSLNTSEQVEASLDRATGTAGGGAAVVALPLAFGGAATGVTELSASGGAITGLTAQNELHGAEYGPSVVGWHYKPLDQTGKLYSPDQVIIISTLATITTATVRVRAVYDEIGG